MPKKKIAVLILVFFFFSIFPQEQHTPEPYSDEEFPSWSIDLRRAEIVTLGSVPFTTLGATMGYTFFRYIKNEFDSDYFPNPLAKSSAAANLNSDEQIGIFISSACISLIIGIVDFIITRIERRRAEESSEYERARQQESVIVESGN
ncbi:MAG: hypothetical protein K5930_04660 [Treponemataceae bacterium]|nr:hypothetical protein [Treponemataceae bacterium]